MTIITILGLGEAGALYASGFTEAGASVRGYDPFTTLASSRVTQFDELGPAVDGADLVISLVGASASLSVAQSALPLITPPAIFADFNTGSPVDKITLAALAAEFGVLFADVAVLAPVNRSGSRTPLMTSGDGNLALVSLLRPLDVPIEAISGGAGAAAGRKLLRSVFMKGLAGVILESVAAGKRAGSEDWIRAQIASEFGPQGSALVERLVTGSRVHAARRKHEVSDAIAFLGELDTPSWMSEGTLRWLSLAEKGKV